MKNEIVRCTCGQVLATKNGEVLFLKWRGRRIRIRNAGVVEIVCEKCRKKTTLSAENNLAQDVDITTMV